MTRRFDMPPARDTDPADATLVPTTPSGGALEYAHTVTPPGSGDLPLAPRLESGPTCPLIVGYELIDEIGRGGMGVVYRARQISLNRPVALKMILNGFQASDRDRARFRAEAAAVARLRHPNIVQIFEVGDQGGRPYLALELVDGTTLQERLAGTPQPTAPAAGLIELLARATHHAHQRGIVHRDLKPGNVLLAPAADGASDAADPATARYGVPKITDFGLAKRMEEDDGQTRSGDLLGTPSYMAPEQAAGRAGEVGPAADVYALGAMLYETLTGRPPFRGATAVETIQQAVHDDPVPPGRLRPKLPKDLERICLKCLEKAPARRYASALALADDLRRHLNGESVHARSAPPHERVWRWCRRNPIPAGLLVAAVVGSVSGLWYLSWLTASVARSNAVHGAAQQSETLDELNKYYGKVAANAGGKRTGKGWEDAPGAIPIPATMTIELCDQITARGTTGMQVRLYSDYPFRTRTDGGPRDDFERQALAELRADPARPFHRFEDTAGGQVLRYATARKMAAACVKCHNTHPDSTKTDWKEGDVRGVLEVIRPLDKDQDEVSRGLRGTAVLVAGLGIGVIALSGLTLAVRTRPRRPPPAGPTDPGGPSSGPGSGKPPSVPPSTTPAAPPSHTSARGESTVPKPRKPRPADQQSGPPPRPAADPDATVVPGASGTPSPADATLGPTIVPPAASRGAQDDATMMASTPRVTTPPIPRPVVAPAAANDRTQVADRPAGGTPLPDAEATRTAVFGGKVADESDATRTFSGPPPMIGGPVANPSERGAMVGRFALRGLHAKGGLGEVFTARDTELNREVALKRIQARFADEPASRRRFLSEAEITARLDHPGVVPVFGLVADAAGRPCYAMRFIRGATLKDEIGRYHGPRPGGTDKTAPNGESGSPAAAPTPAPADPAADTDDRRIAFRQLLQRVVAVCQAVAFAHTRGVIHRDIKPANVMVGTFGETLVVDWGLAKVLGDAPAPDDLLKQAAAAGYRRDPDATEPPDDLTQMGTAVGTPAYMSPEQAAGRVDAVGPASDIYSLGALLYCVLTGRAPFGGGDPSDTIARVQRGEFPPPRALDATLPKPLEAVCLKAMATPIDARYPTAQALAADLERWLSDEPVSAYRDPPAARLARWVRRHPARVAGTVSLLLAALVATAVILTVVDVARQRTKESLARVTRAEAETQQALAEVTTAQGKTTAALTALTSQEKQTREQRDAAESARDLARGRFDLARAAFETVVLGVQARLEDRAGTQELRKELLQTAQDGLQRLLDTVAKASPADRADADRLLFWARLQMGDVQKGLGDTTAALGQYESAVRAAEALFAADPGSPEVRHGLAAGYDKLADIGLEAGRTAAAYDAARKALDLRERRLADAPADPAARREVADSKDRLAVLELERGDTRAARAACTESLTIRKELYAADPKYVPAARDLARSHERDADILLRTGDTAAAGRAVRDSLALREAVARMLPDRTEVKREHAAAYSQLGAVEFDRTDMTAALKAYRGGLAVLDAALAHDPLSAGAKADAAAAHGRIAFVLLRTGDTTQALEEARRCNALCRELVAADAGSAKLRRQLARSHEYLGDALLASGRTADALKEYETARVLLDDLGRADPESVRGRSDAAENLERLGTAQLAAGNLTDAITTLCDSAAVRDALARDDAGSARARRALAASQERLCDAHLLSGNHLHARVAAYKAFAAFEALAEADPASGQAKRDLAVAYGKWGEVAFRQADATAAMILWHKSLAGFDAVLGVDAANAQALEDKAAALEKLATINAAVGYPAAEFDAEGQALALRESLAAAFPTSPSAHRGVVVSRRRLGDLYARRGRFDAAQKHYAEARAVAAKFDDAPVFAAELATLADRLALAAAVRAGATNPGGMARDTAPEIRARALAAVMETHLARNEPVSAARAADLLVEHARGADDLYRAAKGYAAAAAKTTGDAGATNAAAAIVTLTAAATAGFRTADDLRSAAWDALSDRTEFRAADAHIRALPPLAPSPRVK